MKRHRLLAVASILAATSILVVMAGRHPVARAAAESEDLDLFDDPQVVTVSTHVQTPVVAPGDLVRATIGIDIEPGWHVNAHEPFDDFLIGTDVVVDAASTVSVGRIIYPEPEVRKLPISDSDMALYEGRTAVGIEFQIPPDQEIGDLELTGTLTYQACDDEKCLPPVDVPFTMTVSVAATAGSATASPYLSLVDWDAPARSSRATSGGGVFDPSRGLVVMFLVAFLAGLGLNLTPCVYPMIPITISIFGSQGGGPRRAFVLAIFYVLGMAITYSALGTLAALGGGMLGAILTNPFVLVGIAIVMVALSLSMFGMYDIAMPQSLSRVAGETRQGVIGSLLMGLTVGIIAAPCIGPFVAGLLLHVGSTGDPIFGFSIFFVLALGLGVPFLVLATLSGSVSALPRSGGWMVWVKKVFGFIMLGMAIYFLTRSPKLVPEQLFAPFVALLAVIGGAYLGWIDKTTTFGGGTGFARVKRIVGVVFVLLGIAAVVAPRFMVPAEGIVWAPYSADRLATAATEGKPVIVDFSAAWCIPCKELDHFTFAAPQVVERAESFVTLKADLTDAGSPAVKALKDRFDVRGVPTVIFLDPAGAEMSDLRFTGIIDPDAFLEKMQSALERSDDGA